MTGSAADYAQGFGTDLTIVVGTAALLVKLLFRSGWFG